MRFARHIVREERKTGAAAGKKPYDQTRIEGLIAEAAGGNFEAFGELYGIYVDRIYRYVFYQVNDKMAAQDITQEVFVKAWKAIKSLRGKGKTFQSWLYRIAHNHLVDYLRNANRSTSLDEANLNVVGDPRQEIGTELEKRELLEMISCLPENQKQVIILKFLEGKGSSL